MQAGKADSPSACVLVCGPASAGRPAKAGPHTDSSRRRAKEALGRILAPANCVFDRESIRLTAGKILRSDDLDENEKAHAATHLREHAAAGNPHIVRCAWCKNSKMLFRDEDDDAFHRHGRGWKCTKCDEPAASQEVKF